MATSDEFIPNNTPERPDRDGWIVVLALSILSSPASAVGTIMPTIVTSLIARGEMPLSTAGVLGATEMIGMTMIQFCAPLFIMRYNHRVLACFAVGLAVTGQFFSLFTDQTVILGGLRFMAGMGEGCMFSLAIASLARTADPDRSFGVALATGQICCAVMLAIIASVSMRYPAQGAIGVVGLFILATTLCIPKLSGREAAPHGAPSDGVTGGSIHYAPAICGLVGMFLLSCAQGSVWPIIGQIAAARGVSASVIASAFSVAGFGGIFGALFAAVIAVRFGRLLPLMVASISYALCLLLTSYQVSFPILAFSLLFFALVCITYFMGVLAALDPSGRLSVITGATIPFGMAAGEAFSGPVVAAVGFRGATFEGAGFAVVALTLMLITMQLERIPADAFGLKKGSDASACAPLANLDPILGKAPTSMSSCCDCGTRRINRRTRP
jgi:DHA1 family inner membrane transport protein